jgi:hypothetical protein
VAERELPEAAAERELREAVAERELPEAAGLRPEQALAEWELPEAAAERGLPGVAAEQFNARATKPTDALPLGHSFGMARTRSAWLDTAACCLSPSRSNSRSRLSRRDQKKSWRCSDCNALEPRATD